MWSTNTPPLTRTRAAQPHDENGSLCHPARTRGAADSARWARLVFAVAGWRAVRAGYVFLAGAMSETVSRPVMAGVGLMIDE
jgi:hypothetical protein